GGAEGAQEGEERRQRHRGRVRASELVEGVVHRELARHVVEVVATDRLKAGGGGVEAGGLRGQAAVVGVGAADDRRQRHQRRLRQLVAIDEGVERALRTAVAQLHVRNVVRGGALA